jgi:hypothetical protein
MPSKFTKHYVLCQEVLWLKVTLKANVTLEAHIFDTRILKDSDRFFKSITTFD